MEEKQEEKQVETKSRRTIFSEDKWRIQVARRLAALDTAKHSKGRICLQKYLKGEEVSRVEAMLAKCCECMCDHADGLLDCENPICPLYPWMAYKV